MIHSIKTELWKAFHNRSFYWALLIGVLVSLINIVENIFLVNEYSSLMINSSNISKSYQGFSLFVNWIAINLSSVGSRIFYLIWPILAAMPYGCSYYQDRKTGLYDHLISRTDSFTYFISKYAAVFLSGGTVIATPVLLNLLLNAMVCPYYLPKVISSLVMVFDGNFLSELFYTMPWIYALIWCIVDFVWGGVTACICFIAGTKPHLQVLVTITPFVIYTLIDYLYTIFLNIGHFNIEMSPLKLVAAASANHNPEWLVISELSIILIVTFTIGYRQVRKNELV